MLQPKLNLKPQINYYRVQLQNATPTRLAIWKQTNVCFVSATTKTTRTSCTRCLKTPFKSGRKLRRPAFRIVSWHIEYDYYRFSMCESLPRVCVCIKVGFGYQSHRLVNFNFFRRFLPNAATSHTGISSNTLLCSSVHLRFLK